jgi:hypothetical protein
MQAERIVNDIFGAAVAHPVGGGIINRNFLVVPNSPNIESHYVAAFLTLYPDSQSWWKVAKEFTIAELLAPTTVKHPEIYRGGMHLDSKTSELTAYLSRQFINGRELDNILRSVDEIDFLQWDSLLAELATNLAAIHEVKLPGYGMIYGRQISGSSHKKVVPAPSWRTYLSTEVRSLGQVIENIDPHKQIGDITGAALQQFWQESESWFVDNSDIFTQVREPRLTHNDARFANFLVTAVAGIPTHRLAATIDFEWALAGDPEVDLVQVENWLQFAPYQEKFWQHRASFVESYLERRSLSPNYETKRRWYHWWRSLQYLAAIFTSNPEFKLSPRTPLYVHQHYELMQAIKKDQVPSLFADTP